MNILHAGPLGCKVGYPFDADTQNADDLADLIDTLRHSELMEPEYRRVLSERARSYFSEERAFKECLSLHEQLVGGAGERAFAGSREEKRTDG